MISDDEATLLQIPQEERIPVDADHSMMVKFDSRTDAAYTSTKYFLQRFEAEAPDIVARRFRKRS